MAWPVILNPCRWTWHPQTPLSYVATICRAGSPNVVSRESQFLEGLVTALRSRQLSEPFTVVSNTACVRLPRFLGK
jgi:hypothetical protein